MSLRVHDDEFDTSEAVVRALLEVQCPQWAGLRLDALHNSGTSNAMWRLGDELAVRLPRTPGAASSVEAELKLLPALSTTDLAQRWAVPTVRHAGIAGATFAQRWAVLDWLPGDDAWAIRSEAGPDSIDLALDVAAAVRSVRGLQGVSAPARVDGERGGPLPPLLAELDRWLDDPVWSANGLVDVAAVRRCADMCHEATASVESVLLHGDLIPGNLLIAGGRLTAVIDWGGAGYGDAAQDLSPAWAVFDGAARRAFVEAVEVDEATWLRARAFELEHAVGAVLYYAPRRHPLADVMQRTLGRVLAASA